MWETLVVYYLHGQTGWFTVRTNVMQNSELVDFVPESPLPFEQINSTHRNKGTKI